MAVPANFAGDRVFTEDAENAGAAAALGDLAAVSLQLLHHLGNTLGDGFGPIRDDLAERVRVSMQTADASKARENSTREIQPMNAIPERNFGAVNNLAAIRLNQVPQFSGANRDPREVVRWINKVLTTAEAHALTLPATINLMAHASTGSASDFIDSMRETNATIATVIRNLELRYGDLCSPSEALTKANVLPRDEHDSLSDFLDKLRYLGKMAKRDIADANERNKAIDLIVEANIRRVLPKGVRKALEERILTRARMGLPPFSTMDLEKECILLEAKRLEYKMDKAKSQAKAQGRVMPIGRVHMVTQAAPYRTARSGSVYRIQDSMDVGSDSSGLSSDEEPEDNLADLAGELFAGEVRRIEAKYQAKGVIPDRQKVFRKAIRRFNKQQPQGGRSNRQQGNRYNREDRYNNRNVDRYHEGPASKPSVAAVTSTGVSMPTSGPPNKLPESPRKPIHELLALANCSRGDCLHCGMTGHMMTSDACPLRGKGLVDRACMKCKKGLHPVDDCLVVFQQPPKPAVAHIYDDSSDSDLNEE